jgi:uncharacterized protein (TIGR03663 family)
VPATSEPQAARRPPAPPPPVAPRPRLQLRPRPIALPQLTVEHALYAAIFAVGFGLRIWDAGSRAMHGDESVHAWLAWNLYNGTGYQYDPVYHGPLQFPVTALFYFLFGVSNLSARLMAILFGSALVVLPFFLRRYMGRAAALVASALIAVSPAFVYVSRLERDDIFTSVFALTMVVGIFGYVQTRRPRYLYLLAASAALSLSAMENTYITFFIFGAFMAIVLITEQLARATVGERLRDFWQRTGSAHLADWRVVGGVLVAVLLVFGLTVWKGLYLPVPLVLVLVLVAMVHRQALLEMPADGDAPYGAAVRGTSRQVWLNTATIVAAILFLAYSTFGTNLNGIWDSAHASILGNAGQCPGNSFPLNACRKDILGGLFYWLSQHKVARGGQPWFYYSLLYGLYEQLVILFGVGGIVWFWRRPTLFTSFLIWWAVWAFGIYSWAGEKFPWLMIHPLLPFTLLAALFIVELVRHAGVVRYVALAALAILGILEIHSMYEVNFVNGADPVEMMVYVQSSPDTPKVANDILSLSNKVTNGNTLHVTVDSEETWPFAWYLRGMPNVGYPGYPQLLSKPFTTNPVILADDLHQPQLVPKLGNHYTGHEYVLRWWFPEDYKALTWSSFFRDAVNPNYWHVVEQWLVQRRPFGPKGEVLFYYYVKNGLASPY